MSAGTLTSGEEAQLAQTIEMFEVITQSQSQDYQSLEILKEAYFKLGRDQDVLKTSKAIASAYVQMGQISSAILELESILQRHPDDADVLSALQDLESRANELSGPAAPPEAPEAPDASKTTRSTLKAKAQGKTAPADADDGRQTMYKIFVEGKVISAAEFDLCWVAVDFSDPPGKVVEPFIQLLLDKNLVPLEKSLKLVSDKSRLGYFSLDKYDVDVELARTFPVDSCQRWCVLPFDRMSKSILVATANPFNRQAAAEFEEAAKQRLLWYLAPPPDIVKHLKKIFR